MLYAEIDSLSDVAIANDLVDDDTDSTRSDVVDDSSTSRVCSDQHGGVDLD